MACARDGNHGAECSSGCGDGGVIVNMAAFDQVEADLATKTVAAGGGATLGQIYYELEQHGAFTLRGTI